MCHHCEVIIHGYDTTMDLMMCNCYEVIIHDFDFTMDIMIS